MAMSQQTVQTRYCHQVHLQGAEIFILPQDTMIDLHLAITTGTDIGPIGQDPIPTVIDTEVTVRVTHKEVTAGHTTDIPTEAHHATDTQTHIAIDGICHIEDLHHTEVSPHIPETAADPDKVHCTEIPAWHLLNLPTAPTGQPGKPRIRNINKSPLMTPHPIITALMNLPVSQMRI